MLPRIIVLGANVTKQVKQLVDFFCKRIYELQFVDMPEGTRSVAVDRDARIVSDYLATNQLKPTHSTYYIVKHATKWSEEAIRVYGTLKGNHNARCSVRLNGSHFTVEHEYPLGIMKQMVRDKKFKSPDAVVKYMKKYGMPVIVTLEEDAKLRTICRTAYTLKEAEDRYKKAGIVVQKFEGIHDV